MSARAAWAVGYVAVTLGLLFSVTAVSTRHPVAALRLTATLAALYVLLLVALW